MSPLRKKLEALNWPVELVGWVMANWFAFCFATSRIEIEVSEAAAGAVEQGPVVFVHWHSRMVLGSIIVSKVVPGVVAVRDTSPAGRLGGVLMRRAGLTPIGVRKGKGMAATRAVLKAVKAGQSLALAADGPRGPARVMGPAPLEWAGITGLPVVLFAWSARPHRRGRSWDRLVVPLPFSKGVARFDLFPGGVPRRQDAEMQAALKAKLTSALDAHTDAVDASAGVDVGDGFQK